MPIPQMAEARNASSTAPARNARNAIPVQRHGMPDNRQQEGTCDTSRGQGMRYWQQATEHGTE